MARFEQELTNDKYRQYVTESLRLIPQNKCLVKSFKELLDYKPDRRTGDEIAEDIILGAGLNFGDIDNGNDDSI